MQNAANIGFDGQRAKSPKLHVPLKPAAAFMMYSYTTWGDSQVPSALGIGIALELNDARR